MGESAMRCHKNWKQSGNLFFQGTFCASKFSQQKRMVHAKLPDALHFLLFEDTKSELFRKFV